MKSLVSLSTFLLTINLAFGGTNPIIFVHGSNSLASPWVIIDNKVQGAWLTWYPDTSHDMSGKLSHQTAMTRILNEHHGGYIEGKPLNCHEGIQLESMSTTKVIYNFSFYHSDGSHGAIGSNGCLEPVSDWERGVYNSVVSNGSWAKNLADFVDRVLEATSASKVDIVAHCEGGLVARAAIRLIYPSRAFRIEKEAAWG